MPTENIILDKVLKQDEILNKEIQECKSALYQKTVTAIVSLLHHAATRECPVEIMFRYVDDDCEQSIYRIKKVYLDEDNHLLAVYDSNNGENDAADVRFEYDEDFEKEETLDFSVSTAGTFDIELVLKIYSSLVNYDIPRFLKKRKEEHRKLLEEHEKTWKDVNLDELDHDELLKNKEACYELYEKTGFLTFLDSPYMKGANGWNGTPFKVLRRATTDEADLEVMPIWLIQYENGEKAYCYPEEISVLDKEFGT